MKCQICGKEFEKRYDCSIHIYRIHKLTLEQYTLKYILNNIPPQCACGCGKTTLWSKIGKQFNKYYSRSCLNKHRWENNEFKEVVSHKIKQTCNRTEHKKILSDAMKRSHADPGSKHNSEECKKKKSDSLKKLWEKQEFRDLQSKLMKERLNDPNSNLNVSLNSAETKKKRRESAKRLAHDPIVNAKRSASIKRMRSDPNSKFNSEETKKKILIAAKNKWKDPNSKLNTEEYRKNRSEIAKKMWNEKQFKEKMSIIMNTDEYKETRSKIATKLAAQGRTGIKKSKQCWIFNRFSKKEEFVHSSYEKKFLEQCMEHDLFSTKNSGQIIIKYKKNDKDSWHRYCPDFIVIGNKNYLVEIKGYVMDKLIFEKKNIAAKKWCEENNFKFIVLNHEYFSKKNSDKILKKKIKQMKS